MKDKVGNEEAPVTNLENPIGQLAHALEEQYSRPLPSDINGEDKRECNFVPLSFEEEIQDLTLVMEKKNELANDEELLVEKRQVEEQHLRKKIENVLVRIDKFNSPIDFVTLGMEENQQVSSIGRPSKATSQAWIDVEHGEMTLLVDEERLKFNLHQNIQLMDEEKKCCMGIESPLLPFDELSPTILQEETHEGYKLKTNSFPTKDLAFELTSHSTLVEELILTRDEDEKGVLVIMDKGPK